MESKEEEHPYIDLESGLHTVCRRPLGVVKTSLIPDLEKYPYIALWPVTYERKISKPPIRTTYALRRFVATRGKGKKWIHAMVSILNLIQKTNTCSSD